CAWRATPGTPTDLTVKPHARRNIQLQRAEFVPVRIMRTPSATEKLNAAGDIHSVAMRGLFPRS
ncbi:hypothetical protein, partial [Bradyrhizobium sp.]|uniref:hypothetical protein n=1 Tax=Bradyrhizobium sp. TaxID=376 RepID=UPI002E0846E7|nr:hypothetical protein [Bradyrhizobium sp.]